MSAPREPLRFAPIDPETDELDRWLDQAGLVFEFRPSAPPGRAEVRRIELRAHRVSAAYDGEQLVATYRSWDTELTVPGGSVVADAISSVTVRPTHRRRGALTGMIVPDLADAAARGVPVAILIASEAVIYGRFGFAPATQTAAWEVDLSAARLLPTVPRTGNLEVVLEAELRQVAPEIYRRARRPGAIDRTDPWWDLELGIVPLPGDDRRAHVAVLHRDDQGTPTGYLRYTVKDHWEHRLTRSVLTVGDLQAATDEAYLTLWRYLLEQDLVAMVRAEELAVDEPLPYLLTDGRRARLTSRDDFQWSRLLDPAAALSARRYESPAGTVHFDVEDPFGWATGAYSLTVDATGAGECIARDAGVAAEVVLDVAALSGCWLGGGDLAAAGLAGLAREHVPGALTRLAGALRTGRAPWTPTWF